MALLNPRVRLSSAAACPALLLLVWNVVRTEAEICADAGGTSGAGFCDLSGVLP